MTRALLILGAALALSVTLACKLIDARGEAAAWRDNAHYAARLAVSLCRTDTECLHAGDVADDYGAALPFAGRDSWTD